MIVLTWGLFAMGLAGPYMLARQSHAYSMEMVAESIHAQLWHHRDLYYAYLLATLVWILFELFVFYVYFSPMYSRKRHQASFYMLYQDEAGRLKYDLGEICHFCLTLNTILSTLLTLYFCTISVDAIVTMS